MNLSQYVGTLNLLGDESRLRLCALLHERELSVTDLVRVTGISQSRVSTHLARLREGGFVRDRRDGQHAFYALAVDKLPDTAKRVLEEAMTARELEGDRRRLAELGRLPEAFAGEMERHYSPGRTWQSLAVGLGALLDLGDVLDVGSGDGAVAGQIAPYCRSLTCVDASARMIEAAKERLATHENVAASVADAHALPFKAGSFDDVLLFHTLTYAERPADVLAECARVLRPKGRLVVLSLDAHEQQEVTVPYGERHPGFSPRTLKNMLTRAGLTVRSANVACRETKKPHFQVVLAIGNKP
jgi:ArsR family transcriptional regulator